MAQAYVALRRQSEDDLLPEENANDYKGSIHPKQRSRSSRPYQIAILTISLVANIVLLGFWLGNLNSASKIPTPPSYAKAIELPTVYKPIHWNTQYSSVNHTIQDKLWDEILPSHGFVAIDRSEAASHNYPESMYLPGDKSKGVYLLGAYHQLHCLKIIQRTMRESLNGAGDADFTWKPGSHLEHCFDYLIQTAMCNADTTPNYTFGDNTAGDGQLHRCADWDALRDYATRNRACYRDTVEDVLLGEHFGYCDDGSDGLVRPERVEEADPLKK